MTLDYPLCTCERYFRDNSIIEFKALIKYFVYDLDVELKYLLFEAEW